MKTMIATAAAALLIAGSAVAAAPQGQGDARQTPPPAASAPAAPTLTPLPVPVAMTDVPLLGVAKVAPTCGDLHLSAPAYCVTAPLSEMNGLSELYIAHYESLGWLSADGDDNRIVMVKRRQGGGCDGMQIVAFYDTATAPGPATPGFLGFASIPGNVCAAPAATAQ